MTTPTQSNPDFDSKHPRDHGKFAAKNSGSTPTGPAPLTADVTNALKQWQRENGLPVTGVFDPKTVAALNRVAHATGGKGKSGGAAKKLKAARAAAKKAARASKVAAAKSARQQAVQAAAKTQALARGVNRLPVGQRATIRRNMGKNVPQGYMWDGQDRLVTVPSLKAAPASAGASVNDTILTLLGDK